MTTSRFVAAAVLVAALAVPGSAQSASELLQKGIYTQETAGDLDGAIQIYRQIVSSSPAQHEIAAEAQFRLAQVLVRKGDLTGAALEYQKLARDYSEYQALISRLAVTPSFAFRPAVAPPPPSAEFEVGASITVTGTVTHIQWVNPRSWIHLKDGTGTDWAIQLASPNQMMAQGATRNSLELADPVTVNASPAKDGSKTALAITVIRNTDGKKVFDRASISETPAAAPQLLQYQKAADEYKREQRELELKRLEQQTK